MVNNVPAFDPDMPEFLDRTKTLPAMIETAARLLSSAANAAEVLEAREKASEIYDAAKRSARMAAAKGAHDELIDKLRRAQAKSLEIESAAQRRLADEYDSAQERGDVATGRDGPGPGVTDGNAKATAADIGLLRKDVHEARQIRNAEDVRPGIVKKTLDDALAAGEEPTRAKVKRAVRAVVKAQKERAPKRKVLSAAAVRIQVLRSIAAMSGFPAAAHIVDRFYGTNDAQLVDEHLSDALKWLQEFAKAWAENDGALGDAA
jgi:hypothetical protein